MNLKEFIALSTEEKQNLTQLELEFTQEDTSSTLDTIKQIPFSFSQCKCLKNLSLNLLEAQSLLPKETRATLHEALLEQIFLNLPQCPLEKLNLSCHEFYAFTTNELNTISSVFATCTNLRTLILNNCHIAMLSSEQLKAIFSNLSQCKTLQELDLSSNDLGSLKDNQKHLQIIFDSISALPLEKLILLQNNFPNWDYLSLQTFHNRFYNRLQVKGIELEQVAKPDALLKQPLTLHFDSSIIDTNVYQTPPEEIPEQRAIKKARTQ